MKKTVLLALLLCFILAGVLGFVVGRDEMNKAAATAAPVEDAETAEAGEAAETEQPAARLDVEALYALHQPDEVVLSFGEREITWGEYFYYLYRQALTVENYFDSMAMYGVNYAWGDAVEEGGEATFADYALTSAETTARSISAMSGYAQSLGLTVTEADRATIAEKEQSDYVAACGENGTREDFEAFLGTIYMPVSVYDFMNEVSVLYQNAFTELYGKNGEKLSDAEALSWMEKNEYMAANHILLATMNLSTGEALDDAAKADKLAKAQSLAEELKGITDAEALLARFAELKEEYDEDTGKIAYPDGYVFTPGTMVSEFEQATKSQEAYQVSDPVETSYGYHVILTLPLDPDAVIQYSSAGTPQTARSLAADEAYTEAVLAYEESRELVWKDGFEAPDLMAFVK